MFSFTFSPTKKEYMDVNQFLYFKTRFQKGRKKLAWILPLLLFAYFAFLSIIYKDTSLMIVWLILIVILEVVLFLTPAWKALCKVMQNADVKRLLKENGAYISERTWTIDENKIMVKSASIETKLPFSSIKNVFINLDVVILMDENSQYRFLPLRAMNSKIEKEEFLSFVKHHWPVSD